MCITKPLIGDAENIHLGVKVELKFVGDIITELKAHDRDHQVSAIE